MTSALVEGDLDKAVGSESYRRRKATPLIRTTLSTYYRCRQATDAHSTWLGTSAGRHAYLPTLPRKVCL